MSKAQQVVPGESHTDVNIDSDPSDDDDEGLLEPRFKYERVDGMDAKQMLASQVTTSIVAHEKLIAVGTLSGYIWIMDHQGHVDHQHVPVIILCPNIIFILRFYSFIFFKGKIMREITVVGIMDKTEFVILVLFFRSLERMISLVNPSHDVDRIRSSRFPPSHCWLSDSSLAIGWADTVSIIVIITVDDEIPNKRTEIHFSWHLGMFCSGISTIIDSSGSWSEIVLFGLKPDSEAEDADAFCDAASMVSVDSVIANTGPIPFVQMCVLAPKSFSDFMLLAEDRIGFNAKPSSQPNQFHLAGLPSCEAYFLMGPTDLVIASPYCVADAVKWRAENGLLEEAWELAKERGAELEDGKWDSRTVGRALIGHLLESGKTRVAVARLKEVCAESRAEWEWAVGVFERVRLCTLLAEVLPTANPQLEPECYESVLHAALYNDVRLFKRLVQQWNPDLYRAVFWIYYQVVLSSLGSLAGLTLLRIKEAALASEQTNSSLSPKDEVLLYHALAHLYVYERKFDCAIKIYMNLKDQQIFAIVDKYQLFELKDLRWELCEREVRESEGRELFFQMAYLTKLLNKNEGIEFADQAVRLYAEYDRKKLLPFLRKNENYHISRALEVCRQKNYVEECGCGCAGSNGGSSPAGCDECMHYASDTSYASDYFRIAMIPASLISLRYLHIPLTMSIPGLRDSLTKVLRDYAVRVQLERGCRESTLSDARVLLSAYLSTHALAVPVGPRTKCSICGVRFFIDRRGSELKAFGCGHVAHTQCCLELYSLISVINTLHQLDFTF
uniref:RING-type domain-containing protein n=1 Tax=Heterorhabditis bacteriophora TaxID=37862 RepID=A0A1I7X631_HETBA